MIMRHDNLKSLELYTCQTLNFSQYNNYSSIKDSSNQFERHDISNQEAVFPTIMQIRSSKIDLTKNCKLLKFRIGLKIAQIQHFLRNNQRIYYVLLSLNQEVTLKGFFTLSILSQLATLSGRIRILSNMSKNKIRCQFHDIFSTLSLICYPMIRSSKSFSTYNSSFL